MWGLLPHFYSVRQLRVCWCGALSLTRRRVCCLQLLLVLAKAVIFGSESRGTRDHILPSQIRDFPFRRLLRLAGLRWRYSTPPTHGKGWIPYSGKIFIPKFLNHVSERVKEMYKVEHYCPLPSFSSKNSQVTFMPLKAYKRLQFVKVKYSELIHSRSYVFLPV
jgi:hypothetical protein